MYVDGIIIIIFLFINAFTTDAARHDDELKVRDVCGMSEK